MPKARHSTSGPDDVCVLCFRDISIRSVMDCEHVICYECSTRLRVLCEKLECPICRQETTIAVFSSERGNFKTLYLRSLHSEDKYKLAFEDELVRRAFDRLLANDCPKCEKRRAFGTFRQLQDHVRREHQLYYCDLCVKHLKIFNKERKLYNRESLALHRRKGDPDDSSHRGHPLCEFCDQRYIDKDELFLHLRRDHFYCHLCEADGHQFFYENYQELQRHFRSQHFLCEQGECQEKKFIVFRTNIDLQAHRAAAHSENKSRAQQRQERVLTLEFSTDQQNRRRRNDRREQQTADEEPFFVPPPPPPPEVNTNSEQDFPTLGGAEGGTTGVSARNGNLAQRVASAAGKSVGSGGGARWSSGVKVTDEDFPSLAGPVPQPTLSFNVDRRPARTNVTINVNRRSAQAPTPAPSTGSPTSSQPRITQVSSSGNITIESPTMEQPPLVRGGRVVDDLEAAFPSLSVTNPPARTSAPTWSQRKTEVPRAAASAAPPSNPQNPRSGDDFPALAPVAEHGNFRNYSGTNSVKFSVNGTWSKTGGSGDTGKKGDANSTVGPGGKSKKRKKKAGGASGGVKSSSSGGSVENGQVAVEGGRSQAAVFAAGAEVAPPPGFTALSVSGHNYQQPENFTARNVKLVSQVKELFRTPDHFNTFKTLSAQFRNGEVDGQEYYRECMSLLGNDKFGKIFPELLVLLPDIQKQTELLTAHETLNKNGFQRNKFLSCPTCSQILVFSDYAQHTSRHFQESEFPGLT